MSFEPTPYQRNYLLSALFFIVFFCCCVLRLLLLFLHHDYRYHNDSGDGDYDRYPDENADAERVRAEAAE